MTASLDCFGGARLLSKTVFSASSITPISNYGNSGIVRFTPDAGTSHIFAKVWGADAPSSVSANTVGAVGGYAQGLIALPNTSGQLIIAVGGMGDSFAATHKAGKNGAGNGGSSNQSGGGGYSAIFNDTDVMYPPLLMMAGGAGANDDANGGGTNALPVGSGGATQTTGNSGGGLYNGDGSSGPGSGSGRGSGGGFFGGTNGGGGSGHLDTSITHGLLVTPTAGTLVKPNSTDPDFVTPTQDYSNVAAAYNGLVILYCYSGEPFAAGLLS